jgi:hypothetical protein
MRRIRLAEKADRIRATLDQLYPEVPIPLDHTDAFTLLVAVVLSAQCTDARVNLVTPALFKRAKTARTLARLSEPRSSRSSALAWAPSKAKNLKALAERIVEHGGAVPEDFEAPKRCPASVTRRRAWGCHRPRSPRVSGRHTSMSGGALGVIERHDCRAHRARPRGASARVVEPPAPADHLLRVLPGARARLQPLSDLFVGGQQGARGARTAATRRPPLLTHATALRDGACS